MMPIANLMIPRLLNALKGLDGYDKDDLDVMRYVLESILWETEKLIYLFVIFLTLGYGIPFLICLIAVITIRPSAGGFHSSTTLGCFLWSLFGFALAIFVLPTIPMSNILIALISIFSITVTVIAAPLRSKQMEKIAKKDKDFNKKLLVTGITIVWVLMTWLSYNGFLLQVIINHFYSFLPAFWILFLQNFQLGIEWIKREKF